jgi:DNA polymerase-3 subunit alpha
MCLKDKKSNVVYNIEQLEKKFKSKEDLVIILDSYKDGAIVEDRLIDIFETGEKEVYEMELDNGITIKCTMDHKFICDDNKAHTVRDIVENDLNILYS